MPFSSPLFHLRPNSDSLRRFADSSSRRAEQQQRRFAFRHRAFLSFFTILVALVVFVLTRFHCEHKKMESALQPLNARIVSRLKQIDEPENPGNDRPQFSGSLPRGIVEPTSDLELKPLWNKSRLKLISAETNTALLAIPVGIKQKKNVDVVARKFLSENFSVILFHYDGNVDGWRDLGWSNNAIHITALNQTKWWFAKRFLHPDVLSAYDYIFLWDEDLGVEKFHPGRYLRIMISEGLEISQPALDPHQSEVHHRITIRNRTSKVHRRVYGFHGSLNCSDDSRGPPCAGWVEGMAPVFSQAAWRCVWHLIQNDLIHGWGLDMKLGYCAQGDPTKKVGVIDSEFVIHMGIQSLGGSSEDKHSDDHHSQHGASEAHNDMVIDLGSNAHHDRFPDQRSTNLRYRVGKSTDQGSHAHHDRSVDQRSHAQHGTSINLRTHAHSDRTNNQRSRARKNRPISLRSPAHQDRSIDQRSHIRRQSTAELEIFRQRWELAVKEDEDWVDPFENKEKGKRKGKG